MNIRKRVFLLDDDPMTCRFIEQAFKQKHHLTCFQKEADCAQALQSERPDVIIIDYNLEKGSGLDFYEDLHHHLDGCEIIFLSSQQDLTVIFEIINSNIGRYVIKDENMLKSLEYLFVGDLEAYEELL